MSAPIPLPSPESAVSVCADARRRLWEIGCNIALSLLFLRFAAQQWEAAWETLRLSNILVFAKVSTDVLFYLIRRLPKGVSLSPYDWCVGILGTFAIVLFRPEAAGRDLALGQGLQLAGIALQVAAMLSLNRSIGMVAANRGVQTQGLYRWVRHPLYLSYIIAFLGYVVNHPSDWNLGVYAAAVALWILRLLAEERFLMQDPQYQAYCRRVRCRLLPGLF
jgi:protein-S-isoprenylcysteine O-methyltransferase Ste14